MTNWPTPPVPPKTTIFSWGWMGDFGESFCLDDDDGLLLLLSHGMRIWGSWKEKALVVVSAVERRRV